MADLTDSLLESIENGESPTRCECAEMAKCIRHLRARRQRAEELLSEARIYVADATAGTVDMDWQSPRERVTASIDAFLGEKA